MVLLGDACQAVSLFAGHGAALAMAAAWVLRRKLVHSSPVVERALAGYEQRMQPNVARVQKFGRGFVEWVAPSSRWRIAVHNVCSGQQLCRAPDGCSAARSYAAPWA